MNNPYLDYLKQLLDVLEYYNRMAPFPVYDTEYVTQIKKKITLMEDKSYDYDEQPVVACKHCRNLFIVVDEVENDVCMRCGAINELTVYADIVEYLNTKEKNEDN
tara:strand:+ start:3521 stop:3835 length:315 start_codon:yes stop_codon:yes gene_type:complete